jgi:lysophospholipase L1-like esterase
MSGLYAFLAAAAAAQSPSPAVCQGALCNGQALRPFLARLGAPRPIGAGPVHIIQLGDSHTAGDMITQPLRDALQRGYGRGGRGVLPPGRPYPGYLTWGVTASQSGDWTASSIFGRGYSAAGAPVGLSGYTQTTASAGATLGVSSDDDGNRFDRMTVCALKAPGAGTVTLRIGARQERWSLESPRSDVQCRTLDSDVPVSSASLTTETAQRVSVTSFATFRKAGGVALSNLGVSGSQLIHQSRQSDAVVRAELQAYRPDLIVLAFGTNEGFSPRFDAAAYEASLRAQIARIRRLAAREVPMLMIGAPDAATRNPALAANAGPARACGAGVWTPSALAAVRERQRRVARELGIAFWDWHQAMGGACSAFSWTGRGLMRGDLVHFTRSGGERIGQSLAQDLAAAGPVQIPAVRP